MMLANDLATSRTLGVAEKLLNSKVDKATIYSKKVVLTGEIEVLNSQNGKWCFVDALMLLSRVVSNLTVIIPHENIALFQQVSQLINNNWFSGAVELLQGDINNAQANSDAILSVGYIYHSVLPHTVINSNGWVARVSSLDSIPNDVNQVNPIAALMAASLGVTEVFKRIFSVSDDIAPLLEYSPFSLFELSSNPLGLGPELPSVINLPDTLIVGAGAIGNGLTLLLTQLTLEGKVYLVDKQNYADENLGTSLLVQQSWLGKPKADQLGTWLRNNSELTVVTKAAFIESITNDFQNKDFCADLVLNALDNPEARHTAQEIWPGVIIDGAINEVGAAVIKYRLQKPNTPCLKCWFAIPVVDQRTQQSILTGLKITSLGNIGRRLSDEDISNADDAKKAWLINQQKAGKSICSIISEAALSNNLGVKVEEGFQPSVPFVATAAAALVISEAVKTIMFPENEAIQKFHIDSLFLGTNQTGIALKMKPSNSCQCLVHHKLLNLTRENRLSKYN